MTFRPDPQQARVLAHDHGPLLVTGGAGTGKSVILRERFADLIERGADPERVALVVRTRRDRGEARRALLGRVRLSLPGLRVLTVHGLAHHVVSRRFEALDYERPPEVLTAVDQFSKVRDLLRGEDPSQWPAYGSMLSLRGFADEVRQFLLRAQEALVTPEDVEERAAAAGLPGWRELAAFYRRYLEVLDDEKVVDFAGLVVQAAVGAGAGEPLFDHLLVDDFQEATFATEKLLAELRPQTLVVAGDAASHVFSFQGTTVVPLEGFARSFAAGDPIELATCHRAPAPEMQAWFATHTSDEHAAVARELRRIHVEEGVGWSAMAVVVRRQGSHLGGVLRALDDAGIPRSTPERGLSLLAEPATFPFVLALRWLGRPEDRDGLVESLLTSELVGLSPAAARGLIRAARSGGSPAAEAIELTEGLSPREAEAVAALRDALAEADRVAGRSVLDAFRLLWRRLPYAARLVRSGRRSREDRRNLDAVVALSQAVSQAGERADASVAAFLDLLDGGDEGPGWSVGDEAPDAVHVLTAHGSAGQEFDTVVAVGTVEGNFPSLARPEPMFDLQALERRIAQSERNRLRLEEERRLFRLVAGRARRRVLFTAAEPHGEGSVLSARSRFVDELGVEWEAAPAGPFVAPLTTAEARASWRRTLADRTLPAPTRLAALDGLVAVGDDPGRWWFQRDWTQTDRPLHETIRVSYSKLETLENCALQYVLSEELGLEGQAGYHAWVGHLVHRLIEDCENGVVVRDEQALLDEANRRWRPEEFPSLAVSEAFRRLVTGRMLPAWMREYGKAASVGREVRFEFDFEGATVTGYIDRVGTVDSGGTQITDYKTGKSRNAKKAEDNLQLGIYYLAVSRAEELAAYRPVRAVELAFLRDRETDALRNSTDRIARTSLALTSRVQPGYERAMVERLSGLIARLRELHQAGNYRPSAAANCRFCAFKTLCPIWPEGKELFPEREGPADGPALRAAPEPVAGSSGRPG